MDGVLTDFDESFKKASDGIAPRDYEKKFGKDKFWELIDGRWSWLLGRNALYA